MKKIIACLIVVFTFLLVACEDTSGFSSPTSENSELVSVLTSESSGLASSSASTQGSNSTSVSTPEPSEPIPTDRVVVTSIEGYDTNYIKVTFSAELTNFNENDISIKAYNSDFYSLKPAINRLVTIESVEHSVNAEGKTEAIFKIKESLKQNGRLEDYFEVVVPTGEDATTAVTEAANLVSWQMDNGGWDKDFNGHKATAWDGIKAKNYSSGWKGTKGELIGTIDNDATYSHMRGIAAGYAIDNRAEFKQSFQKALDFLDDLQYENGGFAQVYPRRGNYSDYITYNDNAMVNVLRLLEDIKLKKYPFNTDLVDTTYYNKVCKMLDDGIDCILKTQINSNGQPSCWCAQYEPVNLTPARARDYEHPSNSGSESIAIIKFLLCQQDNEKAVAAAESAIKWLDENKLENIAFNNKEAPYFTTKQGVNTWYRFYEIGTNRGIFGDRNTTEIFYDITQISKERREGYSWAGTWPQSLINTYSSYGYYPGKLVVSVVGTNSTDKDGKTLLLGETFTGK